MSIFPTRNLFQQGIFSNKGYLYIYTKTIREIQLTVGHEEGCEVGTSVGLPEGENDGSPLGCAVGERDGKSEGL